MAQARKIALNFRKNPILGALKIGGWNNNIQNGEYVMTALDNNADDPNVDPDLEYEFRVIIHRENYNYGHSANASAGARKQ